MREGEVGLDDARDDVDRGALRCDNHMDSGGATHLGKTDDKFFYFISRDEHEVGELVDDDDDVRKRGACLRD